jgi:hypothetical protein
MRERMMRERMMRERMARGGGGEGGACGAGCGGGGRLDAKLRRSRCEGSVRAEVGHWRHHHVAFSAVAREG